MNTITLKQNIKQQMSNTTKTLIKSQENKFCICLQKIFIGSSYLKEAGNPCFVFFIIQKLLHKNVY